MKVFYWHKDELPLMSVGVHFKGGADINATEKSGQAAMTADMLSEGGAGALDAQQFSKAVRYSWSPVLCPSRSSEFVREVSVTTANFDKALNLFADALERPKFDEKEWARVQKLTAISLEQENDNAGAVAAKVATKSSGEPNTLTARFYPVVPKRFAR